MRLKQIRLAGFKSFVDPTVMKLPSNLVGIVGPNGCGKSNVIDAVRWVMGEASAKHLRGESMVDVIFNGSSGRKPVGQASVELCFDNSDGSLGGEYASFSEISIKRSVTRDAVSHYFLNGTRCRRKDILDIFLGTGLGPRSYAIIEQGTISRIIEAKPDELRLYFEEVAGISKYKERRRETENRLKNTEENLARLNDIREELGKQLNHLNRQAQVAEKYKAYREECRLKTAEWQALQWREWHAEQNEYETNITQLDLRYEAEMATLRRIDAETERGRETLSNHHEQLSVVQNEFYRVGGEMQRIEQERRHRLDRAQQLQQDRDINERQQAEIAKQIAEDESTLNRLRQELSALTPQLSESEIKHKAAEERLAAVRETQHTWQQGWDLFLQQHHAASQQAEVTQTKIQQLEVRVVQLQQRQTQLETEKQQLDTSALENEMASLADELDVRRSAVEISDESLQEKKQAIQLLRNQLDELNRQIHQFATQQQQLLGQQASLQALQKVALGKDDQKNAEWLRQHALDDTRRLAETLTVEPGWEKAVEAVLDPDLQAICIDHKDRVADLVTSLPPGDVSFYLNQAQHEMTTTSGTLPLLSSLVHSAHPISKLNKIYAAPDLATAWTELDKLPNDFSIVTPDGVWLSREWISVNVEQDASHGVLLREKQLQDLDTQISANEDRLNDLQEQQQTVKETLQDTEQQLETIQQQLAQAMRQQHETTTQIQVKQQRLNEMQTRQTRVEQELASVYQQIDALDNDVKQTRATWQLALDTLENQQEQREEWLSAREQARAEYEIANQLSRDSQKLWHEQRLQVQALQNHEQHVQSTIERAGKQRDHVLEQHEILLSQAAENAEPLDSLKSTLDQLLEQHHKVEAELTCVREKVAADELTFRQLNEQRQQTEKNVENIRDDLEKARLARQTLAVKSTTLSEQIIQAGFEIEAVLTALPEDASVEIWQEEVTRIETRIQRLGAINLAAIEEYQTQFERKAYLDSQNADLVDAMETLQSAIRKIDHETRDRLQETYDIVNDHFRTLFPKIFGGGSASIQLTGTDLLESGVSVIAQPPGKRNSTIHLLSGGEKALTAIALVFALFQLNPSPFCMLDEVDAPLDDMNVNRYCRLVKEMSAQVQFIIISHNKITMEMAEQLTGVTMHEPGVSRLVAVDIDAALALAEA